MKQIFFDNASTTRIYPEVISAMIKSLEEDYGNPSSIHQHGRIARMKVEDARKRVAKIMNCSIGEIFFTSSATEANNTILKSAVESKDIRTIIASPLEHHCVIHTLDYLRKHKNINVKYLDVDDAGHLDYEQLERWCKESKGDTLVTVMHGNNEIGTMNDIERIGTIAHSHNVLFHCDAVQTVGKYDIDLSKLPIDYLSASAHKFHGPKGVGFFYMSGDSIFSPYLHGGAQERNMRAGTENIAGIIGLATALEHSIQNAGRNRSYVGALRQRLEDKLKTIIPAVRYNGCEESRLYHILSVSFPEHDNGDMLIYNLDIAKVSASSGSACSSGIEHDSHVMTAIRHPQQRKAIRFSLSEYNTEEEVDYVVDTLQKLVL